MVQDVQRAVRFIRANAAEWSAYPNRIALVGGSAGGYLSNMVGLLNSRGDLSASDPVDSRRRERPGRGDAVRARAIFEANP